MNENKCINIVKEFIDYIINNYKDKLCLIIDEYNRINLTINDKELNVKLNDLLRERLKNEKR